MLPLLLHALRLTAVSPDHSLVRLGLDLPVQQPRHALLGHDRLGRPGHLLRRQPFLPLFAFVEFCQLLTGPLQTPLQLLVLPGRVGQRSHQPAPLRPGYLPTIHFPLQRHVQAETRGDQFLRFPIFSGAIHLLQRLPGFPDRLQQRTALLGGHLRLGQRAKVIVVGAGQVSSCAQGRRLAVADEGLAALTEGLLYLLDLRDIQGVIGTVARDDERGHRHAQRVQGGHGDLDLGLVVAIFAMTELEVTQLREDLDVGVGGGSIDAKKFRVQVVNTDGVLVEVHLAGFPGIVPREVVEQVGQAIILEIEGTNGFAQTGSESVKVVLRPGLKLAEAVIALGSDEGDPDAGDLPEGQRALPAVPGGKVAIKDLGHLQAL
jgi:hypothetical protein